MLHSQAENHLLPSFTPHSTLATPHLTPENPLPRVWIQSGVRFPETTRSPFELHCRLRAKTAARSLPAEMWANFRETTNRASKDRWQRSNFRRRARRFVPSAPANEPRTQQQGRSGQTPRKSIQGERRPQTLSAPSPFRSSSREQDRAAQSKPSSNARIVWRRRSPTRPAEALRSGVGVRSLYLTI